MLLSMGWLQPDQGLIDSSRSDLLAVSGQLASLAQDQLETAASIGAADVVNTPNVPMTILTVGYDSSTSTTSNMSLFRASLAMGVACAAISSLPLANVTRSDRNVAVSARCEHCVLESSNRRCWYQAYVHSAAATAPPTLATSSLARDCSSF